MKPIVGTNTCEIMHLAYVISGQLKVKMDDGPEAIAGPGDVVYLQPGS